MSAGSLASTFEVAEGRPSQDSKVAGDSGGRENSSFLDYPERGAPAASAAPETPARARASSITATSPAAGSVVAAPALGPSPSASGFAPLSRGSVVSARLGSP